MRRYSLSYFLSQSIKGLWRNGVMTIASIAVLMSCLLVMGSFGLLVLNLEHNLEGLDKVNEIVAFVDNAVDDTGVTEIEKKIKALENVDTVRFVSKAEALAEEAAKNPTIHEGFTDETNPYPASFYVTYDDPEGISTLQYELMHIEGIYRINDSSEMAQQIESLKNGIIYIFVAFLAILFIVSIFVIINTIRLAVYSRREEIAIMRFVGATNWFISFPFLLEGIMIGIFSSAIAFFIQWYLYIYIQGNMLANLQMISLVAFDGLIWYLAAAFVVIGVFTGIVGSSISLRKYLKA